MTRTHEDEEKEWEREREREKSSFKEGKKTSMAGIRGPRNFISYQRARGLFLSHLPKRFSAFLSLSTVPAKSTCAILTN